MSEGRVFVFHVYSFKISLQHEIFNLSGVTDWLKHCIELLQYKVAWLGKIEKGPHKPPWFRRLDPSFYC